MSFSFFFFNLLGFGLNLIPYLLILYMPYNDGYFRLSGWKKRICFFMYGLAVVAFPFYSSHGIGEEVYEGVVKWCAILVFFIFVRDRFSRKMVVFFTASFFDNLRTLLIWAFHMVYTVLAGIPIETVYTETHFPYDAFQILIMTVITLLLLLPLLYFERKVLKPYLSVAKRPLMWAEMLLLGGASMVCFLAIIFYLDWFGTSDDKVLFFILIPFGIFLLLNLCVLFVLVFRVSLIRAREQENWKQLELMRANFRSVQRDMERSRKLYHDLRQLLRQLHTVSDTHQIKELKPYIEKIVSLTERTDTLFCENQCLNGLFQYYTGYANEKQLPMLVSAVCGEVPVDDADLTLLLANALENAIEGAIEYRASTGKEPVLSVVVGIVGSYLAIQIVNSCAEALYSPGTGWEQGRTFLSADCFQSRHPDGGHGLQRMQFIAEKYHGTAGFLYDEAQSLWTTRLSLLLKGGRA